MRFPIENCYSNEVIVSEYLEIFESIIIIIIFANIPILPYMVSYRIWSYEPVHGADLF